MATADELIMQITGEDYHEDLQFIIDENMRTIAIPKDGVVLGVCGDKDINRVNFRMNRYYNGFDLSTFSIRINYINSNDEPNYFVVTDIQADVDYIIFTWLVDAYATKYVGEVRFCVRLFTESEGKIDSQFFSTIGKVSILEGIEVDSMIPEAEVYDIITRISSDVEDKIQTKADAAIASIPADYTALSNDVSELKEDLDNIENDVVLVKNLVIRHVSGYYVGDRDGKVTFNSNSSYGYVVIKVDGGKTYSLSIYGSDNFSRIADINGNDLGKPNLFRDTSKSGYVFTMPAHAEYMYVCSQGWNTAPNIVALNCDDDITKLSVSDYPYNKIVRVIIDKFYIPSKNKFLNDLLDDKTVNYDDIHGSKLIELRDDLSWTPFSAGSSKVTDNNNGSYTFTRLSSTGGGATSQLFKSNSDKTTLNIKGMSSVGNIAITLRICDEYGSTIKSVELFNGDVGTSVFEKTLTFDSAYYNVYENAKQYKIFITSEGSAGDTITFSCLIYEPNALQKTSIYNYNFADMMVNVDNALNSKETDENIEYFMMSPNGDRFVLTVDNDGSIISIPTIPSKTLFIGNSILLGLGVDRGGLFGMCASNPQSDYAYHVEQAILSKNSSATFTKVHGAGYEQSTSEDEYLAWWNGTNIATNSPTKDSFTSDLDLIIIQLGDNINTNDRVNNLSNTADTFLSNVRNNSPKARIIWVDGWFNSEKSHDEIKKICSKWKISNVYIKDLNTTENQGYSGQIITCYDNSTFTAPDTYITHPGDYGMLAIANRIIDKMNM